MRNRAGRRRKGHCRNGRLVVRAIFQHTTTKRTWRGWVCAGGAVVVVGVGGLRCRACGLAVAVGRVTSKPASSA